ncbi:ABC transporter substrate-binding protein [Streptomyces sp. NPDC019396]|uniref:ABC transporter substrate-binding protein n=1 Tax=Streptomyces sp. NPDC019396 TaxID=3154687 RepID=UPI0033E03BC3
MNKRWTPRLTVMTTCMAIAVGLTACGQGEDGSDGETKLTMYYPVAVGGPLTKVVDKFVADYEAENPDVDIEAIYSGTYRETMTKAQTGFRARQGPDLAVLLASELYTLTDSKMIVPYDDLLKNDDQQWLKGFYPALMKSSRDGTGKTWGVPFQRSTIVQYYNKDLFAKAGLDPLKGPDTWGTLVSAAQNIKKSGVANYGIEIPTTDYGFWFLQALSAQSGKEIFNPDGTEVYFDAPETVRALEFLVSLGTKRIMPKGTIEWGSTPEDFIQGQTAMMWSTTGNLTSIRDKAKFKFGVTPLPANSQAASPTGGGNLYIFKTSDEKQQAALKFVQWLSEPKRAADWSIATGYIATSPASYDTDAMKKYIKEFPQALVARDQLSKAVPELTTHAAGRLTELLNDAVAAAVTGEESPREALSNAQEQADSVLQQYK